VHALQILPLSATHRPLLLGSFDAADAKPPRAYQMDRVEHGSCAILVTSWRLNLVVWSMAQGDRTGRDEK